MVCCGDGAPFRTSLVRTAGAELRALDELLRVLLDAGATDERIVPLAAGAELRTDDVDRVDDALWSDDERSVCVVVLRVDDEEVPPLRCALTAGDATMSVMAKRMILEVFMTFAFFEVKHRRISDNLYSIRVPKYPLDFKSVITYPCVSRYLRPLSF